MEFDILEHWTEHYANLKQGQEDLSLSLKILSDLPVRLCISVFQLSNSPQSLMCGKKYIMAPWISIKLNSTKLNKFVKIMDSSHKHWVQLHCMSTC